MQSHVLVNVRLSLINAHGGMQRLAMPKGRSFVQTLPRGSVLGFIEESGNQTETTLNMTDTMSYLYVLLLTTGS